VSASQFDKHKAWTVIGDGDDTRHGVCTMYCSCRPGGAARSRSAVGVADSDDHEADRRSALFVRMFMTKKNADSGMRKLLWDTHETGLISQVSTVWQRVEAMRRKQQRSGKDPRSAV
jgi:hypothetical protein